jgi:hypothetical protein
MIHPNRLENDSIMAPVVQEAGIVELNWEQLEGIQGGGWFKKVRKIAKNILKKLDGRKVTVTFGEDQSKYDRL